MSFLPPSSASGNQLTASLRQDHDIIKKVLKATSACIELLKEGKEIPPVILLDTVDFITNFIDRCDHAKEEQGLFPALEATGYMAFHYCRKALERKRKCGKRYGRFCRDKRARNTG